MSDIDLRCGRWQDVLADVTCDALIADPPYGERTHGGQRHGRYDSYDDHKLNSRGLNYERWTLDDVTEFVQTWSPRVSGWFCAFTSHDLAPAYMDAFEECGRYVFAPVACVQHAMNIRLAGDGPSNWTTWLIVARPRTMHAWGTLPGAYVGSPLDVGENTITRKRIVPGGKPLWLMQRLVNDYSRPGDLICDPCAGGATTLLAAAIEGRRAVGSEMDPVTHAKAIKRIAKGYTPVMFQTEREPIEAKAQESLFDGSKAGG